MSAPTLSSPTLDHVFICSWCSEHDECSPETDAGTENYGICRNCLKERLSALTARVADGAASIAGDRHSLQAKRGTQASLA